MAALRLPFLMLVGLVGTAVALVLAEVLDAPWLQLVALVFLVGTVITREVWTWKGHGRMWAATLIVLLGVFGLAFLAERLT